MGFVKEKKKKHPIKFGLHRYDVCLLYIIYTYGLYGAPNSKSTQVSTLYGKYRVGNGFVVSRQWFPPLSPPAKHDHPATPSNEGKQRRCSLFFLFLTLHVDCLSANLRSILYTIRIRKRKHIIIIIIIYILLRM